jgi:membrane fusion protein (multidrug efflux system)
MRTRPPGALKLKRVVDGSPATSVDAGAARLAYRGTQLRSKPSSTLWRRPATWLTLVVASLAIVAYAHHWWTLGRFLESTNDGYIRADQVVAAPRVSGYVDEVLVVDNQSVQVGQPLVRIDAETYRAVLARQRATFDARQTDITVAEARVQQQLAAVDKATAKLDGSRVGARFAAKEAERYRILRATGAESVERLAQMVNDSNQADVAERSSMAALNAAKRQTETLRAQIGQARAQAEAADAAMQEANLDVGHTLIRASIAGRVGDLTVRVGQFVQPGTRMLSIVPGDNIYVVANFKETQISGLRVGQPATISVDALRGQVLRGVLDSFSPSTGAQFALLPPENATGNFTKVVQRVPVRFTIAVDEGTRARLLPGLSVTVEIDTRSPGHPAQGGS